MGWGGEFPVLPIALRASSTWPASSLQVFALARCSQSCLDFGASSTLGPFHWSPHLKSLHRALPLRPLLYACRRICVSYTVALLVNAVKAAAGTLRLLADSLESAADRAAAAPLVSFRLGP